MDWTERLMAGLIQSSHEPFKMRKRSTQLGFLRSYNYIIQRGNTGTFLYIPSRLPLLVFEPANRGRLSASPEVAAARFDRALGFNLPGTLLRLGEGRARAERREDRGGA